MLLLLLQPAAFAPTARVAASSCASPHAAPSSTPSFAMISSDGRAGTVLMAGGRGKKAPRPASGGFGAAKPPPPTLESVCAGFPTRLPSDAASTPCVCGSGDAYACCCQPYHLGEKRAESAERCVRTRYSGFAYRLPRYIIETTHRSNRDYMKDKVKKLHKGNMFDSVEFVSLEVSDDDEARAEAKESAEEQDHLRLRITLQPIDERTRKKAAAEPVVVNERSRFVRGKGGGWLYAAGEVSSDAAGLKGRVLNSEKDLEALKADTDYVKKLLKDPPAQ